MHIRGFTVLVRSCHRWLFCIFYGPPFRPLCNRSCNYKTPPQYSCLPFSVKNERTAQIFRHMVVLEKVFSENLSNLKALSMSVICHLLPWMSSMDEVSSLLDVIHSWHFHSWMRFLHPLMISTDDTFIHGWNLLIHGWNCYLSDSANVLQSFGVILAKIGNLCEQNVTEDNSIHG